MWGDNDSEHQKRSQRHSDRPPDAVSSERGSIRALGVISPFSYSHNPQLFRRCISYLFHIAG